LHPALGSTVVKHARPLLLAAVLLLAAAPPARADGDPAGDILANQTVFYGSALDLRSKPAAQLPALLAESKAKGYEIRVAALSVMEDLGAITYMWDDPTNYAEFLGAELVYVYPGRTLVVMPSGFAVVHPGHSSVRDQRIVDKLDPVGEDPAAVIPGAMESVIRLAAARGIKLTIPDVEPPPGGIKQPVSHYAMQATGSGAPAAAIRPASSGSGGGWLFALPMLAVAAVAAVLIGRSRLRTRRATRS